MSLPMVRICSINDLDSRIAKMTDISPRMRHMNPIMIAANIHRLSRMKLPYAYVARLIVYLRKNG